jgi:hypothetical protein
MRKFRDWPRRAGAGSHAVVRSERERLVNDVQHELFGLGPLEPLLKLIRQSPTSWSIHTNDLHRAPRQDRAHQRAVQRRRAPDARDRTNRFVSWSPHR